MNQISRRRAGATSCWLAVLVLFAAFAPAARAQTAPGVSAGPVEPAAIEDLVAAGRILVAQGVLDGFGHVSMRHPKDPSRFLMARSVAPALVTAADIVEHDLDGNGIDANGRTLFLERFIHAEIYRARPDVMAVVHSHSPATIPFSVTKVPMQAMFHNSAFVAAGVPVFDIRTVTNPSNMLIGNATLGKALAATLGSKSAALIRGHGNVAVGPSVQMAVFRAVYLEVNARLQLQAVTLGGPITFLTPEEGQMADKVNEVISARPWQLWKQQAMGK